MQKIIAGSLIVAAFIHLMPVSGILGAEQLFTLYGVALDEPNLEILMQHRAVLFGILGAFLLYAAFEPAQQALAIVAGLISAGSFLVIAWSAGAYNDSIGKVVIADIVAMVALLAAAAVHVHQRHRSYSKD